MPPMVRQARELWLKAAAVTMIGMCSPQLAHVSFRGMSGPGRWCELHAGELVLGVYLIYNELTSAKIAALSCKISSQDTMTDSKVRSESRIVFYALEKV